jgi:hypothetical protein
MSAQVAQQFLGLAPWQCPPPLPHMLLIVQWVLTSKTSHPPAFLLTKLLPWYFPFSEN